MDNMIKIRLNYAETDVEVAKHLNENFRLKPKEIISYHCQQLAEPIRSLLLSTINQVAIFKIHNLSFLFQQMKNVVDIPGDYYDKADALTPFGNSARYPNELFIEDNYIREAICNAQNILEWTKSIIYSSDIGGNGK